MKLVSVFDRSGIEDSTSVFGGYIIVRARGRAPIHVVSLSVHLVVVAVKIFSGLWWTSLSEQMVTQVLKLQEHATVIH